MEHEIDWSDGVIVIATIDSVLGVSVQRGQRISVVDTGSIYGVMRNVSGTEVLSSVKEKDLLVSDSATMSQLDKLDAIKVLVETFSDTDAGDTIVNLPVGDETEQRIMNVGTSGNMVTINPNGAEKLLGENSAFFLNDGEDLLISYNGAVGWY